MSLEKTIEKLPKGNNLRDIDQKHIVTVEILLGYAQEAKIAECDRLMDDALEGLKEYGIGVADVSDYLSRISHEYNPRDEITKWRCNKIYKASKQYDHA